MNLIIILLFSVLTFTTHAETISDEKTAVSNILTLNKIASSTGETTTPECLPSPAPTPVKLKWATVYDWKGRVMNINIVSPEYAVELFNKLKNQPHIPFEYPSDGCYARAHEMSLLLEKEGVITGKVFIEGDLKVETKAVKQGYVEWWYHVAPIIIVKEKESVYKTYVFDPSIFDKPVPVEMWYNIQTKHFRGRMDKHYFTKRFYYSPTSLIKNDNREEYSEENLKDTKETLKKLLDLQNKLKGM